METKERVLNLLDEQLGIPATEIKEDNLLIEDLGMDSLDVVEIIMGVEKEFGLKIDDNEASEIRTVKDLIEKIEEKRHGR